MPTTHSQTPHHRIIKTWWQAFEDRRGERAQLRRCKNVEEVLFVPYYQNLYWSLSNQSSWKNRRIAIAAVAGLLAHVETNQSPLILPKQMAQPAGDNPVVSELRFRRLLKCETHQQLYPTLRRVILMLNRSVDLEQLVDSVYWWNDKTRQDWAFQYYEQLLN